MKTPTSLLITDLIMQGAEATPSRKRIITPATTQLKSDLEQVYPLFPEKYPQDFSVKLKNCLRQVTPWIVGLSIPAFFYRMNVFLPMVSALGVLWGVQVLLTWSYRQFYNRDLVLAIRQASANNHGQGIVPQETSPAANDKYIIRTTPNYSGWISSYGCELSSGLQPRMKSLANAEVQPFSINSKNKYSRVTFLSTISGENNREINTLWEGEFLYNDIYTCMRTAIQALTQPEEPSQIIQAISRCFDNQWWHEVCKIYDRHRMSLPNKSGALPTKERIVPPLSASLTAAVAYRNNLYVAHIGDNRAILCRDGIGKRLTVSHNVNESSEQVTASVAHPLLRAKGLSRGLLFNPPATSENWQPSRPQVSFLSRREVASARLVLMPGDVGKVFQDNEIAEFVACDKSSLEDLSKRLACAAQARGVESSIHIVIAEVDNLFLDK